MSNLATAWSESVPVADVYERAILTKMAHRAEGDGTGTFPSVPSMAEFAVCSNRSIQRSLAALRERRVITLGDQALATYIPARYRPTVYDLMIPYAWYGPTQLDDIQRKRAQRGLSPLTPEERPLLTLPGRSRKTRADAGITRPRDDEQPMNEG